MKRKELKLSPVILLFHLNLKVLVYAGKFLTKKIPTNKCERIGDIYIYLTTLNTILDPGNNHQWMK